jgi:DNA ligase 4
MAEMRVGATEKTFFDCWHPDADKLFNVTSSLRKVCWDLYDTDSRLEDKVYSLCTTKLIVGY